MLKDGFYIKRDSWNVHVPMVFKYQFGAYLMSVRLKFELLNFGLIIMHK